MVGKIIKVVIALLVLHAAFRIGNAYWNFYRWEDAVQQGAQFAERRSDKQLCEEMMNQAAVYEVPISGAAVTVLRGTNAPYNCGNGQAGLESLGLATSPNQIFVTAGYVQPLQVLPGYVYPWPFKLEVKAWLRP